MPPQESRQDLRQDSRQEPPLSALPPSETAARQSLDTAIALLLLLAASGVLLVVAVLVKLSSPGPLFYRQKRVGRGGHIFEIWKFRTMRHGADRQGPSVTSADDWRITPVGRRLRDWKLDELPQLWNVVRGDMSLVGPRPQVPRFVDCFDPSLRSIVLHVRPGITGPTALEFRHEETMLADKEDRETFYIDHILPVKLEMDARYVATRSLRSDLRILSQTAWMFSLGTVKRAVSLQGRRRHHSAAAGARPSAHQNTPAAPAPDRPLPESTDRPQEDALGAAR